MNDTEGLLPTPGVPSADLSDDLDPCEERLADGLWDGRSVGDGVIKSRAARRADNGLEPAGGPT